MPSSPTARDAAEGLAEIEDVLAEHKAGRISGSLAASTIGLKFLKHQGPLLAALRSADTEGGETQGAAFRVGRRVPENVYRAGKPWLSAGSPEHAARVVTACEASGTKAAQIDYAVRALHADLDTILAGGPSGDRTTDGGGA